MLVEHHMDLVMKVCDEITVLDFGRVIAQRHTGRGARRPGGAGGVPRRERRGCLGVVLDLRELSTSYGPVRALQGVTFSAAGVR